MPALINKVMLLTYTEGANPKIPGGKGVVIAVNFLERKCALPITGCVDFTIYNSGTAKAYLFGSAIEILPGQSWSPPKSTGLPIVNDPQLKFENDYELTRNPVDLTSNSTQQSN